MRATEQAPPAELVRYVAGSTGLSTPTAARVVADVIAYFSETLEGYVRRRHGELRRRGWKNEQIWSELRSELAGRPFGAQAPSERQLRRMVYG
ncbi:hypothetical protein [Haloechinothrix sp. LS1_15]|uniref:hypothetical protein n=1 Tax=Haloechinothrix sp. LS1_15 TaxID=2652248 RepID=UPI0029469C2A|nr:hypothetical protein [Haloechinothrix sp. LS1_15]MDV6012653.1 hypothetical protein [Haloechinothrix sp. LS1_15]